MDSVNSWIKYVKCECPNDVKKTMCNCILFENQVFLCSTCNNYYTLFPYEEKIDDIRTTVTSKIVKVTSVGAVFHCYGETKDENANSEKRYVFFEDHNVALTTDEKKNIGDSQPFMLPPRTLDSVKNLKHIGDGRDLTDEELGRMIHKRNITQEEAFAVVKKARKNYKLYSETSVCLGKDLCFSRHFVDFIFTKNIENENLIDTVELLMREKINRKFKNSYVKKKYSNNFNWIQCFAKAGDVLECSLNWNIDLKDTTVDSDAVEKNLQSHNYFCSKELPNVCYNAYHTNRNLRFLTISDIEKKMNAFQECFAHCDLSQWNGLEGLKQFKKCIL